MTCVHAGLWSLLHRQYSSPDFNGQLASVSYSPYTRSQHPDNGDRPTAEQIRADLRLLSSYTRTIRTYSSTGGVELVPGIAAELGLKVTIGIWLDKNDGAQRARDPVSDRAGASLQQRQCHRGRQRDDAARREDGRRTDFASSSGSSGSSPVPVTTGETWDVWLGRDSDPTKASKKIEDAVKLASAVDFIAAHILPYWDKLPFNQAVDHTIHIYDQLRRAYPGKRIVIAEFGWPSAGYNYNVRFPAASSRRW